MATINSFLNMCGGMILLSFFVLWVIGNAVALLKPAVTGGED